MVGDTSSYLRGDVTSKLVTPSEACWEKTSESHTRKIDTARVVVYLSVHICVLTMWRGEGEVLSP